MARRNWQIQIYTNLPVITGIKDQVLNSPVPVVFDHFGGAQAALGPAQPGFADLLDLVRSGNAYVKISGAYRAVRVALRQLLHCIVVSGKPNNSSGGGMR